jgi:hypothetical protein
MDESTNPPGVTPPYPPPPAYGGPPPPGQPLSSSRQGTTALILGIIGIVCCFHIVSPVAWWLGRDELRDIRSGKVVASELNPKIGMILGIVGTILLVFDFMWAFFFGGLSLLGGLMTGHGF